MTSDFDNPRHSDMKPLDIQLLDGINNTPALGLAIRGWADCEERGLGDGTLNVHATMKAFLACAQNGREMIPAGVMTWEYDAALKRVWIYQSYVLPEFRGRGIYNLLWARMVEHAAIDLKAHSIQSATHIRNSAMRAIAARQGRFEECVVLRFNLA